MAKSILDHTKNNTQYPSNKIIYSPAFLYNQVKLDPTDCSKGSNVKANLDKLKVQGICKESDMPYNSSNCSTQPTTGQITLASSNKIDHYETVPINRAAIKQTINAGFPVVVAFFVDNKFYQDYWNPNNINTTWTTFGTPITDNLGNKSAHATVLYGWDDSKNAFKMLNSWGNTWGNYGSIWVDYGLIENSSVFFEAYKLLNPPPTNTNNLTITGDLNFGNTTINTSSTKVIQLTNSGTTNINVSSISITSPFSTNWNSGTIQPGSPQSVTITFNPTTLGNASNTFTINSNATNNPVTIQATGTGVQQTTQTRIISLSGNLSFGNVTVGQTSSKILTISNTGNSTLTVSSISTPQGFSGAFSGPIPAGGSANVTINFSPTNVQLYSNNITVISDFTSGTNTINANGNGVSNIPTVVPALGTYGACASVGSYFCANSSTSFGLGTINARIVSINTSTHQIVVEIKKCDGTPFNAGGNLNVVNLLCGGSGAVSYGFGSFSAGVTTFQMTIVDNNMIGSKAYVPFIVQGPSLNIYYSAQTIVITY